MKLKIIIAAILSLMIVTIIPEDLFSQKVVRVGKYSQSISGDPLYFLMRETLQATYEQRVSAENSFTIFGSMIFVNENWFAFSAGASYRWYFSNLFPTNIKRAIEGFSAGPIAGISFWDYTGPTYNNYEGYFDDWGGASIFIGGEAAYKWIFDDWVVEPVIRLSFVVSEANNIPLYKPWGAGVNVGYAW